MTRMQLDNIHVHWTCRPMTNLVFCPL